MISATHEVSRKEIPTTKVTTSSLTEKERAKRRAQTIAVVSGSMCALVLFGITVYPSSPLNALFTNTNSEVIASPNDGKKSVTIGALLPLTGAWSSVGESGDAAEKIAINDVNQYFSKSNSNIRIRLLVDDTRTDPATSLDLQAKLQIPIAIRYYK
jgi:ABC-type branched-subunit amino acid transport system substrate-binding protein